MSGLPEFSVTALDVYHSLRRECFGLRNRFTLGRQLRTNSLSMWLFDNPFVAPRLNVVVIVLCHRKNSFRWLRSRSNTAFADCAPSPIFQGQVVNCYFYLSTITNPLCHGRKAPPAPAGGAPRSVLARQQDRVVGEVERDAVRREVGELDLLGVDHVTVTVLAGQHGGLI